MLIKIANFFKVSTDYLLDRDVQKSENIYMIDVTGLSPQQIEHIQYIVEDFRNGAD